MGIPMTLEFPHRDASFTIYENKINTGFKSFNLFITLYTCFFSANKHKRQGIGCQYPVTFNSRNHFVPC